MRVTILKRKEACWDVIHSIFPPALKGAAVRRTWRGRPFQFQCKKSSGASAYDRIYRAALSNVSTLKSESDNCRKAKRDHLDGIGI